MLYIHRGPDAHSLVQAHTLQPVMMMVRIATSPIGAERDDAGTAGDRTQPLQAGHEVGQRGDRVRRILDHRGDLDVGGAHLAHLLLVERDEIRRLRVPDQVFVTDTLDSTIAYGLKTV